MELKIILSSFDRSIIKVTSEKFLKYVSYRFDHLFLFIIGHRFRTFHDFGYVSLDILDVYAQDSGTYTCVAKNALGQAETSLSFTCKGSFL